MCFQAGTILLLQTLRTVWMTGPGYWAGLGGGKLMRERGIVVVEHRYGAALLPRYGQLARLTSRRYGDTAISMYQVGDVDA